VTDKKPDPISRFGWSKDDKIEIEHPVVKEADDA